MVVPSGVEPLFHAYQACVLTVGPRHHNNILWSPNHKLTCYPKQSAGVVLIVTSFERLSCPSVTMQAYIKSFFESLQNSQSCLEDPTFVLSDITHPN